MSRRWESAPPPRVPAVVAERDRPWTWWLARLIGGGR